MFTPRWKKEAILLYKSAKKFVHYKRDLLDPSKVDEIESRRADLKAAIKSKDLDAVKEASKQVNKVCEKSLSHYRPPNALAENLEVFWVAIVVALGVRAYFVQPFRIPTGSMQPSLNGIIAESKAGEPDWDTPWFGGQVIDFVLKGKTYSNKIAEKDLRITKIEDKSFFLFSRTRVTFDDGSHVTIGCPKNEAMGIKTIENAFNLNSSGYPSSLKGGVHFKKGEPIFKGSLTSGDLVLVDKFSYHFRQPKRGESFVFTTQGINTNADKNFLSSQQNGTHYIKRLVAVPGDTIQVDEPNLVINGALAKEETIKRVASGKDGYTGYRFTPRGQRHNSPFYNSKGSATLKDEEVENRNYREFYAFGDNSPNSLDSRYWGSVKQYNLVGPALFSLWPFTSGHWGFIE
ncbi:signal peptidase I [Akkermansiaceae bacterium]|nr:signal peptidase I [Akkermansiaceae bacterium]MDB4377720.1 signal peptidase I [Akkermansiaceae bacterium]